MVNLDALERELSDRKARGLVLLEREFQLGEVPQSGGRTKLWYRNLYEALPSCQG